MKSMLTGTMYQNVCLIYGVIFVSLCAVTLEW